MYAIATLLDLASEEIIRSLWNRFEVRCGLTGIKDMNLPHFSWMSADSFLFEPVQEVLDEIAKEAQPITVRSAGLGIFSGPAPIVYVELVKDMSLLQFHQQIWDRLRPYAIVPNLHYDPKRWIPHITLAYHEVDSNRLGCALKDIAYQQCEFEFVVNHAALIYHTHGQGGVRKKFDFQNTMKSRGENESNT